TAMASCSNTLSPATGQTTSVSRTTQSVSPGHDCRRHKKAKKQRRPFMAIQSFINQKTSIPADVLSLTGPEVLARARHFHSTIPGYQPTPLVFLDHLARRLGISSLLVKDESHRFGLNAFKSLGGSFAIARTLA